MDMWNISSRVAAAGLVTMAVIDVVLVGTALGSTRSGEIDARPLSSVAAVTGTQGPPRGTTQKARPSASAVPSAAASSAAPRTVTTAAPPQVAPLRTMLVAIDNQVAWRAGVGSCPAGGATLASTTDGGTTWSESTAPLRSILRVQTADGRAAFVVGADSTCSAKLSETVDGGRNWGPAGAVGGAWFRDPQDSSRVGAPGLATSQPCDKLAVLDLAVVSTDSSRVLCQDGAVRSTTDRGSSWTTSGKAAGAVALAIRSADPAQTYVARLRVAGCAGVQIERIEKGVATSCIQSVLPKDPGQIALSMVNGGGWVTVGGTTLRSTDDLATWKVS